jgi:hypothetical protein
MHTAEELEEPAFMVVVKLALLVDLVVEVDGVIVEEVQAAVVMVVVIQVVMAGLQHSLAVVHHMVQAEEVVQAEVVEVIVVVQVDQALLIL